MSATASKLPSPIRPGDVITADFLNAMLEAVRRSANVQGGRGITVTYTSAGLVISETAALVEERIPAIIKACTKPAGTPVASGTVQYTAGPLGRPELADLANVSPTVGRPVNDSESMSIYPWAVGTPCWIIRRPDQTAPGGFRSYLEVPTERISFGDCGIT